jgi:hypothetical protein
MTENEVLDMLHRYASLHFPRTCSCGRSFPSLRAYIEATVPAGTATSYDAELGQWDTQKPIGAIVLSNCVCGSTLALSTQRMALADQLGFLAWVRTESEARGVTVTALLESLRIEIRRRELGQPAT